MERRLAMDVKMLAFDLDGTLLRSDKTISDRTLSVLERCRQKGLYLAAATSRSEKACRRYTEQFRPDVIVSSGGSCVRCRGEILSRCLLPAAEVDQLTMQITSVPGNMSVNIEADNGYYSNWDGPHSPDFAHYIFYDFSAPLSRPAYKISAYFSAPVREEMERIAAAHPTCRVLEYTGENAYQFARADAEKSIALKKAAEHLGFTLAETAAFGDDHNDLSMIRQCGTGVAMGNAIPEVKAAADFVCGTNDEDGIALWLEHFLLSE